MYIDIIFIVYYCIILDTKSFNKFYQMVDCYGKCFVKRINHYMNNQYIVTNINIYIYINIHIYIYIYIYIYKYI